MNKNDYIIRLESPADYHEVENLTRALSRGYYYTHFSEVIGSAIL